MRLLKRANLSQFLNKATKVLSTTVFLRSFLFLGNFILKIFRSIKLKSQIEFSKHDVENSWTTQANNYLLAHTAVLYVQIAFNRAEFDEYCVKLIIKIIQKFQLMLI